MEFMKKHIIPVIVSLLAFGACDYNEENFEGLDEMSKPTNVVKKDYTLTETDYASIASNKANKALAEAAGLSDELSALKTSQAFSEQLKATEYIPAFLADTWFSADQGSAIKVSYNIKVPMTDLEKALNKASIYKVSNNDYETVWGGVKNDFFTPTESASKHIPNILQAKYSNATENDIVLVDYNFSEDEPSGEKPVLSEGFESQANNEDVTIEGWHNVTTIGTYVWKGKSYSGNLYIQQSAYKHEAGELESYLITPQIAIEDGMKLTFDACYGNYVEGGGRLSVLYCENLTGFTKDDIKTTIWTDITNAVSIPIPDGTYGTLSNVCNYDLSSLAGKKVYIAFRYNGNSNGATTTVQIDNIAVKKTSATVSDNKYTEVSDLFQFNGSKWILLQDALSLDAADYKAMGSNYGNLDDSMSPISSIATYLNLNYPYAKEEDQYTVAYKYYNGKSTIVQCCTFTFSSGQWESTPIQVATDQFVLNDGTWKYNPSTIIDLPVDRSNTEVSLFYQTITDWVKENYPEYVTSYGNNDYYYGGSAYQNNIDFRPSAWKKQGNMYANLSDEELKQLMWDRLPEAFPHALEVLYASATPIEGIDVIYTINFAIYGIDEVYTTTQWTIQYKVIGQGKFEYIPESLKEIG